MAKVALIIAFQDFRDEEYFIPKEKLEKAGFETKTVSTSKGKAMGSLGGETEAEILISELNVLEFDAVLFLGGPGAHKMIDNENCHRIARETLDGEKILGAICIAPTILARAGVLKGRKATVWRSNMDKSAVKILESSGAIYTPDSLTEDGNIITASGPSLAEVFAKKIISKLQ